MRGKIILKTLHEIILNETFYRFSNMYCGENGCDFMLSFFHTLGVKAEALLVFGTLLGMSGE